MQSKLRAGNARYCRIPRVYQWWARLLGLGYFGGRPAT